MNLEGHDEEYNLDYDIAYTGMSHVQNVPQMKYICSYTRAAATCAFDFFMGWGHLDKVKFKTDMRVPHEEASLIYCLQGNPYASNFKDTALLMRALDRQQRFQKVFPRPLEPLACYCMDGVSAIETTFQDWCSEFGYDNDSIKARKIYDTCIESYAEARKILSHEEIEELGQ